MTKPKPSASAVFGALCVVGASIIAGAVYFAKGRTAGTGAVEDASIPTDAFVSLSREAGGTTAVEAGVPRRLYYRHMGLGPHFGKLAWVEYGGPEVVTFVDALSCEALHVSRDRGICLSADRGVITTYAAKLFDTSTYEVLTSFPLNGVPSRTRMSADGKFAATTVFVTGHGYDSVDFSTQTVLIDVVGQKVVADLEAFSVLEQGRRISNADFNFWGVTFLGDGDTFYATLSTGGRHMLVKGSLARRSVEVVHYNVECPSLSPDGTRVAYKKRFVEDGRIQWQLHVLDLRTLDETPLSERRSVDDQLEWLDDAHVLYSVPSDDASSPATTDVWVAAADGSGSPSPFLRTAYSPAALR